MGPLKVQWDTGWFFFVWDCSAPIHDMPVGFQVIVTNREVPVIHYAARGNALSCSENGCFGVSSRTHSLDQDQVSISKTLTSVSSCFTSAQTPPASLCCGRTSAVSSADGTESVGLSMKCSLAGFNASLRVGCWNIGFWVKMASRTRCLGLHLANRRLSWSLVLMWLYEPPALVWRPFFKWLGVFGQLAKPFWAPSVK